MVEQSEKQYIAGQIEELPTPADSMKLWGHKEIVKSLARAYQSGRLHHAIMLCGPKGIGKATLAFHFTRHILTHQNAKNAPEDINPSEWSQNIVRQVAQSAHPQVIHLDRAWDEKTKKFKTQLTVDDIRKTQGFYKLTSADGGFRITIIDAADDMNANAANALLKILEEPPKKSLFIVIAHAPSKLLATIRSRCQRINLNALGENEIVEVMKNICPEMDNEQCNNAAKLSAGSVRRAIEIAQGEIIGYFKTFENIMEEKNNKNKWNEIHDIAEKLAGQGKDDEYQLFCELVKEWINKKIRNNTNKISIDKLAKYAEVWETINDNINQASIFNLDKKQVVINLFEMIGDQNKKYG